jgi:hypothetical protein
VRNPRAPALLAARDLEYASSDVAIVHEKAYITNAHAGLVVYDVRNPRSPVYEGARNIPVLSLEAAGNYVFAFCYGGTLQVLCPAPFPATVLYETHGEATGAAAAGQYLYVTDMDNGLLVFQRSGLGAGVSPAARRRYSGFWPTDIAISTRRAYVSEYNGLRIYDLADPARPRLIGSFVTDDGIAKHVRATGSRVYLATWTVFRVIDASVPAHPKELDSWSPASHAMIRELFVAGNRAYVTHGDPAEPHGTLEVLGIDAAGSIRQLGALTLPGKSSGGSFCVRGGFAYLADGTEGLRIADVRDPSAMKIVGALPGNIFQVGCAGANTVFAAVDRDPIRGVVVDVTDPSSPQAVGTFGTPGQISGFSTSAGRLFVVTNRAGVLEAPVLGAVSGVSVRDGSTLRATLPGGLPRGSYDVVVRDAGGAHGRLVNGFTVLSPGLVALPRKVSFGDVPLGSRRSMEVELYNNTGNTITLNRAMVTGSDFSLQPDQTFPLVIPPWRKAGLELHYVPSVQGAALGSMSLMRPWATTQPAIRMVLSGMGL